jgi:hypothetical protein
LAENQPKSANPPPILAGKADLFDNFPSDGDNIGVVQSAMVLTTGGIQGRPPLGLT